VFSAFTGPPRILRLFGKGRVFERDTPDFDALLPPGDPRRLPGARAIIWLDVDRVGTSCGYSVPFYQFEGERCVDIAPSLFPSSHLDFVQPRCAHRTTLTRNDSQDAATRIL